MTSPSLTQKPLKFDQIRAKFNCSKTAVQQNLDATGMTKDKDKIQNCEAEWEGVGQLVEVKTSHTNNDSKTTEKPTNVVDLRRRAFEQHKEKANSVPTIEAQSSPSIAIQIEKTLSPPVIHPKPKLFENSVSSLSSEDLESSTLKEMGRFNEESSTGVKSMVEKLNRIGHRPFEPKIQSKVEIAEEVETDSQKEETEDVERCDRLSRQRWDENLVGRQEVDIRANILDEMRGKAIFKKSFIASEIPSDIGKYRPLSFDKKGSRKGCASDPPPGSHCQLGISSATPQTKTNSLLSSNKKSGSSAMGAGEESIFVERFGPIPQYDDEMDEKENKRLRKLHEVALEIYQTQHAYVKKLQLIGLSYPSHLNDCEKRLNKKLLHNKHVIRRIADHFQTILSVHLTFLNNFYYKMVKWDSRKPDLAEVFQKNADFLKICRLFLTEKQKLVAELQQALSESQELADATLKFEQGLLKENSSARHSFSSGSSSCGSVSDLKGISIILQLDAVHQNVVHYKPLMERYRKCLPDVLGEAKNADEALRKLTAVANDLNDSLTVEDEEKKLLNLCGKLRGIFDVFAPGRKLLHSGELKRQTRKELQTRHLILFSDTLLICRCTTLAPLDSLDAKYIIPIEKVQLKLAENDESECEFIVLTPYKSSTFIAKSKWERDSWMKRIGEAVDEAIQRRATRAGKQKFTHRGESELESSSEKPQPRAQSSSEVSDTLAYNGDGLFNRVETAEGRDEANSSESDASSPNEQLFSPNTALWVPDNKSSKCMNGCGTSFALFRRRHHCRQCGCIICSACEGMAPVGNAQGTFKHSKVCPKCFLGIRNAFEKGLLPHKMVRSAHPSSVSSSSSSPTFSLDDPSLRIRCEKGILIHPTKLFVAPTNGPMNITKKLEDIIVSGKVLLRAHQKATVPRWATLSAGSALLFFKAQFDDQPMEHFIIFGYSVRHSEKDDDGKTMIELTHRNQFPTERREDKIIFHVQHSESAKKWLEALRKVVQIEQTFSEEGSQEVIN